MQSLNLGMAEVISSLHRDLHCHLNLDKDFYCYRSDWRTLHYYRYWNMIGLANLVDCSFAYLHCQIIFQETFYSNTQYFSIAGTFYLRIDDSTRNITAQGLKAFEKDLDFLPTIDQNPFSLISTLMDIKEYSNSTNE